MYKREKKDKICKFLKKLKNNFVFQKIILKIPKNNSNVKRQKV